jgi:hypothetical protein
MIQDPPILLPSQREPDVAEPAPTHCRHCGKRYRDCTVLLCFGCHRMDSDRAPDEEQRELDDLVEIFRAVRRGELP